MTHFLGIVAYLLRVESAMACGGSEMGPTADAAAECGAREAIGTAALTDEMPQLKQIFHFISKDTIPQFCLDQFTRDLIKKFLK